MTDFEWEMNRVLEHIEIDVLRRGPVERFSVILNVETDLALGVHPASYAPIQIAQTLLEICHALESRNSLEVQRYLCQPIEEVHSVAIVRASALTECGWKAWRRSSIGSGNTIRKFISGNMTTKRCCLLCILQ